MTPEEKELAQANYFAAMYPIAIQGAGGATINGKTYLWNYKENRMELKPNKPKKRGKNENKIPTTDTPGRLFD